MPKKILKFKRGQFNVAVNPHAIRRGGVQDNGVRMGWVSDLFAIHGNKWGYDVTHLPTGLKATETRKFADAKAAAQELFNVRKIDWKSSDGSRLLLDAGAREKCLAIALKYFVAR